ncbi:MAG: HindIII family type II restriction endonuclease [Betaproteobacteria bacterium]|nr:HindIII family type II restriction endonuclease [Betaproteobacteria bacterium]
MPLSPTARTRRVYWLDEIVQISGQFGLDSSRVSRELKEEIERDGTVALIDHLHLCGTIPEHYGHDSSEEKLYSKYTDALLSAAYGHLGLTSIVLTERADAADVEAVCPNYSLVADAKVFRLSRTAKNQKDFKIEAMHGWKRGKPHAMVVCPIYQLPSRSSQIYQQAIARNVCIFSYSHLSVLLQFSDANGGDEAQRLLLKIFKCTEDMNPTKDAVFYWTALNRAMLDFHPSIRELWNIEKLVTLESITAAKEEALTALAKEREQIMRMSREQAIASLILDRNIDGRERVIRSVADNGLLAIA